MYVIYMLFLLVPCVLGQSGFRYPNYPTSPKPLITTRAYPVQDVRPGYNSYPADVIPVDHNTPNTDEDIYYDYEDENTIPGIPGESYPVYHTIPNTGFSCLDKGPGFFADPATGCQAWYYCDVDGREDAFLCPNGTVYNQERRVCEWWYNVHNCEDAETMYRINDDLYIVPELPRQPFITLPPTYLQSTTATPAVYSTTERSPLYDYREQQLDYRNQNNEYDYRNQNEDYRNRNVDYRNKKNEFEYRNQNNEYEYRSQDTDYRTQNTDYRTQNTDYRTQNTDYRTQNTDYRNQELDQRQSFSRNSDQKSLYVKPTVSPFFRKATAATVYSKTTTPRTPKFVSPLVSDVRVKPTGLPTYSKPYTAAPIFPQPTENIPALVYARPVEAREYRSQQEYGSQENEDFQYGEDQKYREPEYDENKQREPQIIYSTPEPDYSDNSIPSSTPFYSQRIPTTPAPAYVKPTTLKPTVAPPQYVVRYLSPSNSPPPRFNDVLEEKHPTATFDDIGKLRPRFTKDFSTRFADRPKVRVRVRARPLFTGDS